jgi:hypothetical protein
MGKKAKEHRKKVAARNAKLKKEEGSLMNLLKKLETMKDVDLGEIPETPEPEIINEKNKD